MKVAMKIGTAEFFPSLVFARHASTLLLPYDLSQTHNKKVCINCFTGCNFCLQSWAWFFGCAAVYQETQGLAAG